METGDLPDAELRTLVIRLLSELRGRVDTRSENINEELGTERQN